MIKETKKFVSNSSKANVKCSATSVHLSSARFVAKVASVSINRRITISSNFSVAKVKK